MKLFFTVLLFFYVVNSQAQFAPQAGLLGSTAIYKDSLVIINWASNCNVQRGWMNIADTTLGKVTNGIDADANGMADGNVVSLGDGGEAVYYFSNPIVNGVGPDFCVFENGFRNPSDSNLSYSELAFVEVSNDGVHFTRFNATSQTDTSIQVAGVGTYLDARKINNLAGKYILQYGTPFDLEEFLPLSSLNINDIRYIKIKDVVGSIQKNNCSYDQNQHIINDPYPTDFSTGGFDLDALGIIHQLYPTSITNVEEKGEEFTIFPIPAHDIISITNNENIKSFTVIDIQGKVVLHSANQSSNIAISLLQNGNYCLVLETKSGKRIQKYFSKW